MKALVIRFEIKPDHQKQFEDAFRVLIERVRERDPNFELYSLNKVVGSETSYIMMERFTSDEAAKAHMEYDYVTECVPALDVCLAGPPRIEPLEVVI